MCRYWHDVAAAALQSRGAGARLAVVADKNLVPAPRDNVPSRLRTIQEGGSGEAAAARMTD